MKPVDKLVIAAVLNRAIVFFNSASAFDAVVDGEAAGSGVGSFVTVFQRGYAPIIRPFGDECQCRGASHDVAFCFVAGGDFRFDFREVGRARDLNGIIVGIDTLEFEEEIVVDCRSVGRRQKRSCRRCRDIRRCERPYVGISRGCSAAVGGYAPIASGRIADCGGGYGQRSAVCRFAGDNVGHRFVGCHLQRIRATFYGVPREIDVDKVGNLASIGRSYKRGRFGGIVRKGRECFRVRHDIVAVGLHRDDAPIECRVAGKVGHVGCVRCLRQCAGFKHKVPEIGIGGHVKHISGVFGCRPFEFGRQFHSGSVDGREQVGFVGRHGGLVGVARSKFVSVAVEDADGKVVSEFIFDGEGEFRRVAHVEQVFGSNAAVGHGALNRADRCANGERVYGVAHAFHFVPSEGCAGFLQVGDFIVVVGFFPVDGRRQRGALVFVFEQPFAKSFCLFAGDISGGIVHFAGGCVFRIVTRILQLFPDFCPFVCVVAIKQVGNGMACIVVASEMVCYIRPPIGHRPERVCRVGRFPVKLRRNEVDGAFIKPCHGIGEDAVVLPIACHGARLDSIF